MNLFQSPPEASHITISQSETMRQSLDTHDGGVVVEQSCKLQPFLLTLNLPAHLFLISFISPALFPASLQPVRCFFGRSFLHRSLLTWVSSPVLHSLITATASECVMRKLVIWKNNYNHYLSFSPRTYSCQVGAISQLKVQVLDAITVHKWFF